MLLADAELFDQLRVDVDVFALEIVEQATTLTDQLEEAAPGVMILDVGLEMLCQVADALAEQCHLNFRGTRIRIVFAERADNFTLTFIRQHVVPSTNDPESAPGQNRIAVHTVAVSETGHKEQMLSEYDNGMQSAGPHLGQGDQVAVGRQHFDRLPLVFARNPLLLNVFRPDVVAVHGPLEARLRH